MLKATLRASWLVGSWIAAVAIIMAASIALGANVSTTVVLVALVAAPGILIAFLVNGAESPTVAQVLHSVETKNGRP